MFLVLLLQSNVAVRLPVVDAQLNWTVAAAVVKFVVVICVMVCVVMSGVIVMGGVMKVLMSVAIMGVMACIVVWRT